MTRGVQWFSASAAGNAGITRAGTEDWNVQGGGGHGSFFGDPRRSAQEQSTS